MTARLNTAAEIAALRATLEADMRQREREREDIKERDKEAAESREAVRKTLDKLENGHKQIVERLDKVEVTTDMVSGFRAKFIGAMFVMGMIGSAILAFLTYFRQQISSLIWGA